MFCSAPTAATLVKSHVLQANSDMYILTLIVLHSHSMPWGLAFFSSRGSWRSVDWEETAYESDFKSVGSVGPCLQQGAANCVNKEWHSVWTSTDLLCRRFPTFSYWKFKDQAAVSVWKTILSNSTGRIWTCEPDLIIIYHQCWTSLVLL